MPPEKPDKICFDEALAEQELKLKVASEPVKAKDEASQPLPLTGSSSVNSSAPASAKQIEQSIQSSFQGSGTEGLMINPENARTGSNKASPSLLRHKLIVGACLGFAALILAVSMVDLKPLMHSGVYINKQLQILPIPNPPQLPPNFVYNNQPEDTQAPSEQKEPVSVLEASWDGGKAGYADPTTGRIVIKPNFATAGLFSDGLAAVQELKVVNISKVPNHYPDRWGYIDISGKYVIPPNFDSAGAFDDGVAVVVHSDVAGGGENWLIDKTGKVLFRSKSTIVHLGKVWVATQGGKSGLINNQGKWIIEPEYGSIQPLNSQLDSSEFAELNRNDDELVFVVSKNGLYGVIDQTGKLLIPAKYDHISDYANGVAAIAENGKYGFVNAKGDLIIPPKYEMVTSYDDLIAVRNGGVWSVINGQGQVVKTAPFEAPIVTRHWFSEGLGAVLAGGKLAYLNKSGELALKTNFPVGSNFFAGYAVAWAGDAWVLIDRAGKIAMPLHFSIISPFFRDRVFANINGPLSAIDNARSLVNFEERLSRLKEYLGVPPAQPDKIKSGG